MTPIAKAIEAKGYKKQWVAEKANIARGTLSAIVNGKTEPSIRVAIKLARILNTTVEDLWGHLEEDVN